jgi:folate-binding protein YgfZ
MPPSLPNPLLDIHRQAEAEFQPYDQIEIVTTYGEPQAEYAAIRKACALIDLPQRGILELTGKDRHAFLNNLLTNETWNKDRKAGLQHGEGVYAFLLNLKGRIITDMNVLELGDRTLLEMDGRMIEPVRQTFDKYLFAEQVKLAARTGELHEIALHGPRARDILNQLAKAPIDELPPLGSRSIQLFNVDMVIWRDDPAGVPGYHLIMPRTEARNLWMNMLARFADPDEPGKRLLRPAGWAAFNATRIEAGRPIFGIDFDDSVLPAESGLLDRAVSFTKGCYLGQEVVARMHARGQIARRLAGIRMEDDALPLAGAQIVDEQGNQIGAITSSTISPVMSNAAICLGYLKKPFFTTGTTITIPAEGQMRRGKVVDLPFI